MNAIEIIAAVRAHDAELAAEDGRLFVRGHGARLPKDLREALHQHKAELLVALGVPLDGALSGMLRDLRPHLAPALQGMSDGQLLTLLRWHVTAAWETAQRERVSA